MSDRRVSLFEHLIEFTKFLFPAHGSGKGCQHPDGPDSSEVNQGKPQPVARVLDEAEDISGHDSAIDYSKMPQRKGIADTQSSEAPVSARNSRDSSFSGRESGEGKVRVQGNGSTTAIPTRISGAGNLTKGKTHCNDGHPAPGGLLLEKIDQEYSRDFSSRAFGKFLKAFIGSQIVDEQGCETIIDENCYGEQVCKREISGICQNCGQRVCSDCEKYETCCCAPKGTSRHRVSQS